MNYEASDCLWRTNTNIDVRKGLEVICFFKKLNSDLLCAFRGTSNLLSRSGNRSCSTLLIFFPGSSTRFKVIADALALPSYPWCHRRLHLPYKRGWVSSGFISKLHTDIQAEEATQSKVTQLATVGARLVGFCAQSPLTILNKLKSAQVDNFPELPLAILKSSNKCSSYKNLPPSFPSTEGWGRAGCTTEKV